MARTARTHGNQTGAASLADQIDLTAPGGIEALIEAHRATFGSTMMMAESDEDDDEDYDALLGDDSSDDDDSDDHDEDDSEDDDEDGKRKKHGKGEYVTAADVERALDRRINVVLREIRKQGDKEPEGRRGKNQRGRQDSDSHTSSLQPSDVRDARASYRDYVGDEISFVSKEERQFATKLAAGLIREGLANGDDPDEVGQHVARDVADSLKGLRRYYAKRTVGKLRQQGRLTGGSAGVQRAPGSKTGPSTQSKLKAGEQMAQQLYANRQQNDKA